MSGWRRLAVVVAVASVATGSFVIREKPTAVEVDDRGAIDPDELSRQIDAVRDGRAKRVETTVPPSDAQWQSMVGLSGLEELVLDGVMIDESRAEILASLPDLRRLVARNSPFDDAVFVALSRCRELVDLNIPQADCTAEGLASLATLPNLRSLRVGGPRLEGSDVCEAVISISTLRFLHLIDVEIGDAGLAVLERRPDLWSLYLDGAGVSDEAWRGYFQACPSVHVHVDQAHHDRDQGRGHGLHAAGAAAHEGMPSGRLPDQ